MQPLVWNHTLMLNTGQAPACFILDGEYLWLIRGVCSRAFRRTVMSPTSTSLECLSVLMLLVFNMVTPAQGLTEILIGAVFSPEPGVNRTLEEEAFKLSIGQINNDTVNYPDFKLRGLIRFSDPNDDFDNIEQVNSLLNSNISILIGPMETSAVIATHPLCSRAGVPQIAPLTSPDSIPVGNTGSNYLLGMSPTEKLKAKVLGEIVKHYKWETMAVLGYQDEEASKGQSNFRLIAYENEWNVVTASLIPPSPRGRGDIRSAMMVLRSLKSSQATRLVVVFCPTWAVSKLMEFAATSSWIKMDMGNWTWIFSNLGNKKGDLLSGPPGNVPSYMRGLLGIKSTVGKGARYEEFKKAWEQRMPGEEISVSAGRVFDSVLVAAEGIKRALKNGTVLPSTRTYLGFCSSSEKQQENTSGKELARHLNEVRVEGVMGTIYANDPDHHGSAYFDVVNLRSSGEYKVGEWNEKDQLEMFKNKTPVWSSGSTEIPIDIPNILKGKTLRIATILAPPFVMLKEDENPSLNKTQEFEGLSIDILEKMRETLKFNYKIYLVPDGKFGVKDRLTGQWNGIVKEIIDKRADMSIAPMTISSDRQTVLDFTQPYMTFGLAFMMRVQEVKVNYFRFLSPFSKSMWIVICVLVTVMGFLLWICSLFSPWGYYGRRLQVKSSKELKPEAIKEAETLSLKNSVWSSWKAYVRQGAEHPRSWSGRMTVSVFWFAVMIINATYTANLAAHLTVSRMKTPIETILDLARQTRIEYGTLKDSQLQTFFKETDVPSYLVMGQFMEQRKTWMPSYEAAINRTMEGDFAFISDRPILNYVSRQEDYCGKIKVTGGFGNTYGYGFAFGLRSQYTPLFNMELFRLQNDFIISSLTHKWTKEKVKCELIDNFEEQKDKGSTVQKMSFQGMLGVFILLVISVLVGLFLMIVEWIYASAKDSRKQVKGRQTCCQACGARLLWTLRDMFCPKRKTKSQETTELKNMEY
ncbi:glutamate receptor ionotropic, kainate 2-like isoform X2 [Oculina patagonica]